MKFLRDVEKWLRNVAAQMCDVVMQDPVAASLLGMGLEVWCLEQASGVFFSVRLFGGL
jgi:hypothetical protein